LKCNENNLEWLRKISFSTFPRINSNLRPLTQNTFFNFALKTSIFQFPPRVECATWTKTVGVWVRKIVSIDDTRHITPIFNKAKREKNVDRERWLEILIELKKCVAGFLFGATFSELLSSILNKKKKRTLPGGWRWWWWAMEWVRWTTNFTSTLMPEVSQPAFNANPE
jgi:hypothetical protein